MRLQALASLKMVSVGRLQTVNSLPVCIFALPELAIAIDEKLENNVAINCQPLKEFY